MGGLLTRLKGMCLKKVD